MTWYLAALAAMLLFGMHNIFVQASARTNINVTAGALTMEGAAAVLLGIYLLASGAAFRGESWNSRGTIMALIAGACIFGGTMMYFYTYRAGAKLSVAGPLVYGGSVAITALFGLVVLREHLEMRQIAGLVFTGIAIYLLR
jgi:uncharacterized membrane protein